MKLLYYSDDGAVELRWMWLPTFIGQSLYVQQKLKKELSEKFAGQAQTEETLSAMHSFVLDWLADYYGVAGLRDYLSSIDSVEER